MKKLLVMMAFAAFVFACGNAPQQEETACVKAEKEGCCGEAKECKKEGEEGCCKAKAERCAEKKECGEKKEGCNKE